ncbi:MAG: hypothetical protein V1760_00735 [Candidatus Peregrinibacteria bacterium]
MDTSKNIHEVSAIFFFILAFSYVIAALAFRNDLMVPWATLFMRILDIPFALVALLYGGSTLYLQLNEGEENATPWSIIIIATCILLFGLVVFVNFAFPSQI